MKKTFFVALAIAAILLAACGPSAPSTSSTGGTGNQGVPVTAGEAKVSISNFAFSPAVITIKAGQAVVWTNEDTVAHNVVADDNSWKSANISNGATFSHTFTTAGTFSYHCSIHPNMKAVVVVTP